MRNLILKITKISHKYMSKLRIIILWSIKPTQLISSRLSKLQSSQATVGKTFRIEIYHLTNKSLRYRLRAIKSLHPKKTKAIFICLAFNLQTILQTIDLAWECHRKALSIKAMILIKRERKNM